MACGALAHNGQWLTPARKPDFLFPMRALSKVSRDKFLAALAQARKTDELGAARLALRMSHPARVPKSWRRRSWQTALCR